MLFSSTTFIFVFLPIAATLVLLCRRLGRTPFLLSIAACSLYLYGYHVPAYLLILLGSATANYLVAGFIEDRSRSWLYFAAIAANLALLAYYKYADFLIGTVNDVGGYDHPLLHIVLPLAISFITFEQIAFLSDVRSGRVPRGSPIEYLAFITLFPKLIAGPIIRYTEMLPQIRENVTKDADRLITGLCIFSFGLFNKVVIADSLAPIVNTTLSPAADVQISGADATLGILAYTTRIYFDFSGYSTMAIGLAWILGFRLPINFLSPYRSTSIIEFWRRWHMTLSRFLRDYLYFPLGGGRKGTFRRYVNLCGVMLLGGLWHGAGWVFVAWGAIHGAALVINHGWRALAPKSLQAIVGVPLIAWPLTMIVVMFGWIFFTSTDFMMATNILRSLNNWSEPVLLGSADILILSASWVVALATPTAARIFRYEFLAREDNWSNLPSIPVPGPRISSVSALALALSLIVIFLSGDPNAFIYFQF